MNKSDCCNAEEEEGVDGLSNPITYCSLCGKILWEIEIITEDNPE